MPGLAGLDIHMNASFWANGGVDGPEVQLSDGRIGGLLDANPCISISTVKS